MRLGLVAFALAAFAACGGATDPSPPDACATPAEHPPLAAWPSDASAPSCVRGCASLCAAPEDAWVCDGPPALALVTGMFGAAPDAGYRACSEMSIGNDYGTQVAAICCR